MIINRIPEYRPSPSLSVQPAQIASQALPKRVQSPSDRRSHRIETYIQEHPATGIGVAFCLGILFGWVIRRW